MGQSEYDPGAKDRRAWNAGRSSAPSARSTRIRSGPSDSGWITIAGFVIAMFDLAIDSKLRGRDVVKTKIGDLLSGGRVRSRAIVTWQKTGRPVQFELLESRARQHSCLA